METALLVHDILLYTLFWHRLLVGWVFPFPEFAIGASFGGLLESLNFRFLLLPGSGMPFECLGSMAFRPGVPLVLVRCIGQVPFFSIPVALSPLVLFGPEGIGRVWLRV